MFFRKMIAFVCTVLISAPLVGSSFMIIEGSSIEEVPGLIFFTYMYAIPVTLLFGVPISILSDKWSKRFSGKKRMVSSFTIHLLSGVSFVLLFMLIFDSRFILTHFNSFDLYFLVASTLISFVGWGMDEVLRKSFHK